MQASPPAAAVDSYCLPLYQPAIIPGQGWPFPVRSIGAEAPPPVRECRALALLRLGIPYP